MAQTRLPKNKNKGLWGQLVNGAKSVFSPRVYAAEIMAATQSINADRWIAAANDREQKKEEILKLDLMLREIQHKESLAVQARDTELHREAQLQLARLQQEFLEQQGALNRDHAEKIELFRADIQKWAIEQQKALQLQLKQLDLDAAQAQRQADRQLALEVIREQKRENNSPIWLLAEDLIGHDHDQPLGPLRVLFSPPTAGQPSNGFPEMERSLGRDLRGFFDDYSANGRPIEFLAGAWNSKSFHSEAATKAIFRGLKTEPVMILEATIEGDIFDLNFAYWGMNWPTYRYKTAVSLSWREALYDFAKARTLRWAKKQQELKRDRSQVLAIYGEKVVNSYLANLRIHRREQECLSQGEDPAAIERNYELQDQDYEDLRQFIGICHCLFAGVLADEYFLLHVPPQHRQPPLLPELLTDLLATIPDSVATELMEMVVSAYETIYQAIAQTESSWLPEFQLDLAASLLKLPQQFRAREKVLASIQSWLQIQGLTEATTIEDRYRALEKNLSISDIPYITKLNQCLQQLGEQQQFDVAQSCYLRGLDRYDRGEYALALGEFKMAVQANPQLADAYYYQGLAALREQDVTQAIVSLTTALQLLPQMGNAYYQRGLIYEHQQQYAWAAADYLTAQDLNIPDAATALQHLRQFWQQQQSAADLQQKQGQEFLVETARVNAQGQIQSSTSPVRGLLIPITPQMSLDLVYVPEGTFTMGSAQQKAERPLRPVQIAPFHMGKYLITQAQWQEVASWPQIDRHLEPRPAHFPGDQQPIDNVSWLDAVEFCRRLSQHTGHEYRLPSEAEWEYACRAGSADPFTYGTTITTELANFAGAVERQATTPVGSFPANAFGLYDLHGNLWEWCADLWHDSYTGAPLDGRAWLTESTSEHRVLRGGSWFNNQWNCRSSNRNWVNPEVRSWLYGFRVVSSSYYQERQISP